MIERIPKERWGEIDWSEWNDVPTEGELYGYIKEGKVIGYYLVEQAVHVGAFTVKPEHRGNGIASALAQHAHDTLSGGYYVAALSKQTEQMCEKFNMTPIEGRLYVKE